MSEEWKFGLQVMLTKGEWLQLEVLAGEMSLSEYAAKVLLDHAQQNMHLTGGEASAFKQLYEGKFDPAPKDDTNPPTRKPLGRPLEKTKMYLWCNPDMKHWQRLVLGVVYLPMLFWWWLVGNPIYLGSPTSNHHSPVTHRQVQSPPP
jgi:hypothetical protein